MSEIIIDRARPTLPHQPYVEKDVLTLLCRVALQPKEQVAAPARERPQAGTDHVRYRFD